MSSDRRQKAKQVRVAAAELAADRPRVSHKANGDEQEYASANYAMSFTKGLAHSKKNGLIHSAAHFEAFRSAVDNGYIDAFTTSVPTAILKKRGWEAPTAGVVYDLQGPDAQAVTMAPAPKLGSIELTYEMAEVYELALLRDVPLTNFRNDLPTPSDELQQSIDRLNNITYDITGMGKCNRPRKHEVEDGTAKLTPQTAFRGSSPGVERGPYLSQFLLIGNKPLGSGRDTSVADGRIQYGPLLIDQRVPLALVEVDYMTTRDSWLAAQNGECLRKNGELFEEGTTRFITTPRDLATYVHDDALYQAYLNACLILIGMKAPFDPGFASLSGQGDLFNGQGGEPKDGSNTLKRRREAEGFALFGGPHILTLVTEVATRALKAVRFQKFNVHMRLRPEALAARLEYLEQLNGDNGAPANLVSKLVEMEKELRNLAPGGSASTLSAIEESTGQTNQAKATAESASSAPKEGEEKEVDPSESNECKNPIKSTVLLPMAFQEGSPMHPSYGAGHATVAGACVTVLKAFFDTSAVLVERTPNEEGMAPGEESMSKVVFTRRTLGEQKYTDSFVQYVPDGSKLNPERPTQALTLEGELNKLAANISIGRNMAGVHYFSDYFDSVRMGEKIAIGMLEEQALCYPRDDFVLSIPTFDGEVYRIGHRASL